MPADAEIQLDCRPAADVHAGNRVVQGFLISPDTIALLRGLPDDEVRVCLVCLGRRPVKARAAAILRRAVQVPYSDDWYISSTATGPLFEKRK
jgi:hypothetical protein